ncbi:hypothetical protein [Paenibacillus arenilitoris]|uniref:Uncharacterized protein n=1 Tax=Paenibacillus arenilitoris TaxID=2772299 RepID=A0A927CKY3_9BACL|nr:hypothetical protein [Paenibacillus arenilitoris]MBD2868687.1 hypothetical protein [Paenibacillus arenilitoris]
MNFLPLPERFDANEWFIVAGLVCGYAVMIPLRKRFPVTVFILTLFYGMTTAKLMDATIGFTSLNFYDINDSPKYEAMDALLHFLYLPFAYFFVYLYDRWNVRGIYVLPYLIAYSLLGVGLEELGNLAKVFTYQKWRLVYSFTLYLYLQSLLLLYFKWLMKHYRRTKAEPDPSSKI